MENWRPRTFRELFIPGYSGRLDWWVAMFAIFFGATSIVGLGIVCYQAAVGQKQLAAALAEGLMLQKEGLNVTMG